jgi:hypothetical protein
MTDADELALKALLGESRHSLPGDGFSTTVRLELERWEQRRRVLSLVQDITVVALVLLLSLAAGVPAWLAFHVDTWAEQLIASPWWLALAIVGVSVLLSPVVSRTR